MTDKQYTKEKKRIQALIDKWVKLIGLGWYEMKYNFVRGSRDPEAPTTYSPFTGDGGRYECIMAVTTDYFYQSANIDFYLETTMQYKDIERYFVHELMHIFLKPMQTKQKAAEEELVATKLADAMIWVYNKEDS